jgi:hypothetical protein
MGQEGWRMLTREFGNFKHVTPLMGVAVAIGVCWAALSLLMMIVAPLSVVIAFMSGPVMVVYGSMLYLSRGLNFATSIGAAVLGVFGLFHMLWMPVIVLVFMASLPAGLASMFDSYPTLVAATGIIFSIVIASITGSWKAFLVMLSGTVVATAADRFLPYVPGPDQIPGFGIAILHLSIVATLLFTTLATIAARERPGVCKSCGYDLAGNVGGVCPECGVDALHPPLHPFDLEVTGERPRA